MPQSRDGQAQEKKIEQGTKSQKFFAVEVDPIKSEDTRDTIPVIGRLVALQSGEISALVSAPIKRTLVTVGDRVKKGDTLVILSSKAIQLELNLKLTTLAYFQAKIETAKRKLDFLAQKIRRLKELKKSPAFSQARLEDRLIEKAQAESEIHEAQAKLQNAEVDIKISKLKLSYTKVVAPYSGVVSKRMMEVGTLVAAGQPLLSLINDQSLEIEADVPMSRLSGINTGTVVEAVLDNGMKSQAIVRSLVPEENPRTRTRVVRLTPNFGDKVTDLAVNQTIIIHILANKRRNVITVHKDAILNRSGKQLIFVASGGLAKMKYLELDGAIGSRFIVRTGVKAGELAVVRGNERLKPDQKISFNQSGAQMQ